MTNLNNKIFNQIINTIDALFCVVDDFNKAFSLKGNDATRTGNDNKKRRRKKIINQTGLMAISIYFFNYIIKLLKAKKFL